MSKVGQLVERAGDLLRPRPRLVPAAGLAGAELVRLGGGEMVATPDILSLPLYPGDRSNGVVGPSLALPPANVRILNDVQLEVGNGVARTLEGAVVGESISHEYLRSIRRVHRSETARAHPGNVASYGTPDPGAFQGLVESFPRALLLQHPALRRIGPIALLHCAQLAPAEAYLLASLDGHRIHLETAARGDLVRGVRAVVAAPVARAGAGAIPRWYRRWLDQTTGTIDAPVKPRLPRRLVLVHGPHDPLRTLDGLSELLRSHRLVLLDTATATTSDGQVHTGADLLVGLRDAELVIGASDDALVHAALCRSARILQVGIDEFVTPRVLQLAVSRALPHVFVRPAGLPGALSA